MEADLVTREEDSDPYNPVARPRGGVKGVKGHKRDEEDSDPYNPVARPRGGVKVVKDTNVVKKKRKRIATTMSNKTTNLETWLMWCR